jgi:hypothetical protein
MPGSNEKRAPRNLRALQCVFANTGSIKRDDELIVLRLMVPTLAWRKLSNAGVSGFWSSLVRKSWMR